ncbi:MAG: hypothetical protein CM15mP120_22530 [Pseudomonadota bacterium]|nr:MAG: hypothetical protein CM15mP120_22530 [Pseudomonadota bacterium]
MSADLPSQLKQLLSPYRQSTEACPVHVLYQGEAAVGRISLGADWKVSVSDDCCMPCAVLSVTTMCACVMHQGQMALHDG